MTELQLPVSAAGRLLALFLPEGRRDPMIGDLEEEYRLLAESQDLKTAARWYRRQVFASLPSVAAQWLPRQLRRLAPARPPISFMFFALAMSWIVGAAWLMQPDPTGGQPLTWPTVDLPRGGAFNLDQGLGPGFATRADTSTGWSVTPADRQVRYISGETARHRESVFLLAVVGAPVLFAFLALFWLALSQLRFRRVAHENDWYAAVTKR